MQTSGKGGGGEKMAKNGPNFPESVFRLRMATFGVVFTFFTNRFKWDCLGGQKQQKMAPPSKVHLQRSEKKVKKTNYPTSCHSAAKYILRGILLTIFGHFLDEKKNFFSENLLTSQGLANELQ